MSIEDDWKDLARGMALRMWDRLTWDDGKLTANAIEMDNGFSGIFVRNEFIDGFVRGFFAAKKRDVVSVDPYKVEPNGK